MNRVIVIAAGLWILVTTVVTAAEPPAATSVEDHGKLAEDVYRQLFDSVRSRATITLQDLELLNAWSARIAAAKWIIHFRAPFGERKVSTQAVQAHLQRMQNVEKLVLERLAAGKCTAFESSAARVLRLQAEGLVAMRGEEIEMKLPEAPTVAEAVASRPRELVVSIDAEGRYTLAGKTMTLAELEQAFKASSTNNPGTLAVVLRVDKKCPYEFVAQATNCCIRTKIHDVRVVVRDAAE